MPIYKRKCFIHVVGFIGLCMRKPRYLTIFCSIVCLCDNFSGMFLCSVRKSCIHPLLKCSKPRVLYCVKQLICTNRLAKIFCGSMNARALHLVFVRKACALFVIKIRATYRPIKHSKTKTRNKCRRNTFPCLRYRSKPLLHEPFWRIWRQSLYFHCINISRFFLAHFTKNRAFCVICFICVRILCPFLARFLPAYPTSHRIKYIIAIAQIFVFIQMRISDLLPSQIMEFAVLLTLWH